LCIASEELVENINYLIATHISEKAAMTFQTTFV